MRWTGRFAGYDTTSFRKDLLSGLIVGIIAIPLGMAFASNSRNMLSCRSTIAKVCA
jgi:MFS superfamily sulfate permease-like transporter